MDSHAPAALCDHACCLEALKPLLEARQEAGRNAWHTAWGSSAAHPLRGAGGGAGGIAEGEVAALAALKDFKVALCLSLDARADL